MSAEETTRRFAALVEGEVVRAVRAVSDEVVLMDCQMPEMDGYEAATAIRAGEGAGRRIPIIAMSAGAMQEDRERAIAAGMDDYLAKPVKKADVLAKLAHWGGRADESEPVRPHALEAIPIR